MAEDAFQRRLAEKGASDYSDNYSLQDEEERLAF
jgi:hypothetical protein